MNRPTVRLRIEALEDRTTPTAVPRLATGAAAGQPPEVRVYDLDGTELTRFLAYDASFTGGVNVAVGDVTGDGVPDIVTAPKAGGGSNVRVFDGTTFSLVNSFYAFDKNFTGGVSLATANVTADVPSAVGEDIIVGAGAGGGPQVKVYRGSTGDLVKSFYAFDPSFRGGVNVAAANGYWPPVVLNLRFVGPGLPPLPPPPQRPWVSGTIVVGAGAGGGPHVVQLNADTLAVQHSFYAFDPAFRGGSTVATVSENIFVGAGDGGGPNVRAYSANAAGLLVLSASFYVGAGSRGVTVGTGSATLFTITTNPNGQPVGTAHAVSTTISESDGDPSPLTYRRPVAHAVSTTFSESDPIVSVTETVFGRSASHPGVTNWGRIGSFPQNG